MPQLNLTLAPGIESLFQMAQEKANESRVPQELWVTYSGKRFEVKTYTAGMANWPADKGIKVGIVQPQSRADMAFKDVADQLNDGILARQALKGK